MSPLASECYSAIVGGGADTISRFLAWLVRRRGIASPVRVLDVGCGPGRMFPAFRSLGWDVASVEPHPDFHEAAVDAARAVGYEPPQRLGFGEIAGSSVFDLVTAINDSFSHLLTGEQRAGALARTLAALRPGGVLFPRSAQLPLDPQELSEPGRARSARARRRGATAALARDRLPCGHVHHDRGLSPGPRRSRAAARDATVYAMTSFAELDHALRVAGFAHVEAYGSYEARAPEPLTGSRILISAVRP